MAKLTPREKIAKARINLLTEHPFFGCIAMRMVPREATGELAKAIPALAVDIYGNLIYNPKWVAQADSEKLKCGIAHEVLHLALEHLQRKGSRNPRTFNIATDAQVNYILSGSFHIPNNWVRIPEMEGKSAEETYDWLIRNAKFQKNPHAFGRSFDVHYYGSKQKTQGGGKSGKQGTFKGSSPFRAPGQQPFDAKRAVVEAHNFAKQQGNVPAGIERVFGDLLNPVMDWKEILRRFLVSIIPHDFTYTYPAKKSYSVGYYMPKIVRERVELVIGVDTSGSISDEEYAEFLTEIYALTRQFDALRAWLCICDCELKDVFEIDENFDPYSIKGRGYGGTSSLPVYDWIKKEKMNNIKVLIYFTDGYIDIPQEEKPFPTLWIITANGREDTVKQMKNAIVIKMPKRRGRRDDW
ncbi:MAG: hypothetical protein DRJ03_06415 [Chloroflexi bacterium]|nr:MAG: hypothetical protein DRJ03_06415 [Chloroflexota bacterium]